MGDGRATQMGHAGEWNIGQPIRENYGKECRSIGFITYSGTFTAASAGDSPSGQRPGFSLTMKRGSHVFDGLREPMPLMKVAIL